MHMEKVANCLSPTIQQSQKRTNYGDNKDVSGCQGRALSRQGTEHFQAVELCGVVL